MKIVLLCKRHNHRKVIDILEAFRELGIGFAGIVALDKPPAKTTAAGMIRKLSQRGWRGLLKKKNTHSNGNGKTAIGQPEGNFKQDDKVDSLKLPLSSSLNGMTVNEYAQKHRIPIQAFSDLNSDECVNALKSFAPDLLVLGGTPIIRANVLAVPKIGTLNVHMGALPKFRGMNVAEWSVFYDEAVELTVHFVDPGVDTGAVLYRQQVDVSDCKSISAMRQKLSPAQHRVLAKAARLLIENQITPDAQKRGDGKQYYIMHEKLRQVVEKKLSRAYQPQHNTP